jgi:hypothetical protein
MVVVTINTLDILQQLEETHLLVRKLVLLLPDVPVVYVEDREVLKVEKRRKSNKEKEIVTKINRNQNLFVKVELVVLVLHVRNINSKFSAIA